MAFGCCKAAGVIRPLRIAEIEQTIGERDGLERSPNGAGQIGAGFHYDRDVRCAVILNPN